VIHHADKAGDDAAVLKFGPTAAQQASSLGAHREAAAQLATVLAHAESLGGEARAEFLERYSYECYLTEQIAKATAARLTSLALWQAAGRRDKEGDTLRWLSRLSWFTGNKSVADGLAVQAVEILETLPRSRELAMAYSNRSQLHMLAGEIEQTLLWGEKAVALARELHDVEIESHALNNVGTARLKKQIPSGRADLERSLELARLGRLQEHAARALTNLGSSFVDLREFALARRYLGEGIAYCDEHDLGSWGRYMVATRAIVSLAEGDWASASLDAESVTRHPQGSVVSRIPALTVLGRIRTRRGDPGAQEILDEAYELALGTTELQRIAPLVVSRAEFYWLRGAPEEAAPELRICYEMALQHPDEWKRGELAFWMWRSGCLTEVPTGLAKPYALQMAGDWAGAAQVWERLGCPYERAVALAEVRSEAALRTALEIFEQLGARPFADLVRRRLRASGVRRVPRGAQERTRRNPHGLTRREMDVLSLVAEGQRNAEIAGRLFVSEKTVDHHVSAVLAKLNVRSRGEASVVANRLGLKARVRVASAS
jgi:DNA-binding CsgD family transcriptional regulator/tetratricopeptide (TPR) repeat protein